MLIIWFFSRVWFVGFAHKYRCFLTRNGILNYVNFCIIDTFFREILNRKKPHTITAYGYYINVITVVILLI
ncbi:hypothetical protein Q765_14820 [Flavobacterium rivuli WB 3.3-2 = DSM 21788]|uniref:Uncharacterized protein n=1 Tax=Flavobacterium rivuli WB 3.3-2 = DSM 21788 TaxID=1121895 RepID=A0A0A2M2P2_9FLAO|nr:hypothetical protein Q765_14820 [Flavobacterium rivuli WB 3.3-2 = DSM 21788]